MPTENRSSNTDPRDVFIRLNPLGLGEDELRKDSTGFEDQRTHSDYLLFLAGYRETHAEPQHHPEPIAWMVGTAFWWTKEEAERDAAATGLPVVPVGPMVDTEEVERLRTENVRLIEDRARFPDRPDDIGIMIGCHIGNLKNQAKSSEDYARKWRWKLEAAERKLAEHDALLIEVLPSLDLAAGAFKSAKPVRNKVKAAISASAEPEATS